MLGFEYITGRLGVGGSNPLAPTNQINSLGERHLEACLKG